MEDKRTAPTYQVSSPETKIHQLDDLSRICPDHMLQEQTLYRQYVMSQYVGPKSHGNETLENHLTHQ